MLSNFQLGDHSLLQIFLLGQPEFRQTLFHTPALEQLRQRVIATHHLDPMEPEEVEPYILHRLKKVGWTGNPSFAPEAFELIYDYSDGVPRKLNVLVSRLLLFGAVEELHRISAQHVRNVIGEIEADRGIDEASLAPLPVDEVVAHAAAAVETPQAWPTPANDGRPPFAAPADFAAARTLVADQAGAVPAAEEALNPVPETVVAAPAAADAEQIAELQRQIAGLEARLVEQDAALRRVLDLLIEWVERDPENSPNPTKSEVWAA